LNQIIQPLPIVPSPHVLALPAKIHKANQRQKARPSTGEADFKIQAARTQAYAFETALNYFPVFF